MTIQENQPFTLGPWAIDPRSGVISDGKVEARLEPRVLAVLLELARRAPEPVSREHLLEAVWHDTVVGEDALPRAILKLRRALGDDAKHPRLLETLPRRGYRLKLAPTPARAPRPASRRVVWGVALALAAFALAWWWLAPGSSMHSEADTEVELAHDYYHQFTRETNEAAITLYRQRLAEQPGDAAAHAGLANALVQRVIRWPAGESAVPDAEQSVTRALASGRTHTPWAQETLNEALRHARRAVQLDDSNPDAHKALGLTQVLQGDVAGARARYQRALALNDGHWPSWVNLGELALIEHESAAAIGAFERAFQAMEADYSAQPQRVGRWLAELGALLGDLHTREGDHAAAEAWYRRVLSLQPWHSSASLGLAGLLRQTGREAESDQLCRELSLRIGPDRACAAAEGAE